MDMKVERPEIREVNIIRYVTPFREGGSLPALVDADDGFSYVIKFRGAGQGKRVLVAELIGGEIARWLGLRMPEMVFADLHEAFGRTEPDEEIQDLLKFSVGKNLGVSFLRGAVTFDANADRISAEEASKIVWLDALLMNVDRTAKNTNMLVWNRELWLIDHGASLYFHHNWEQWEDYVDRPFVQVKDHVLLRYADNIDEVDSKFKSFFTQENLMKILEAVPDEWLEEEGRDLSPEEVRQVYVEFLSRRANNSSVFVDQIKKARESRI